MVSSSKINELFIGEIDILKTNQIASILCSIPDECDLSIIVQDENGRSRMEEKYHLEEGEQVVQFSIANLSEGQYHAWIDVTGKTFIRSFSIEEENQSDSFIDMIKNLFS